MTAQTIQNGKTTATAPATPAAASSFGEAPASATIRTISSAGFDIMWTVRADSVKGLTERVTFLAGWLSDHGYTPAPSRSTGQAAPAAQQDEGDAPTCPKHGPMKRGKRGWYCPHKLLDDDGTGKPAYCRYTVN